MSALFNPGKLDRLGFNAEPVHDSIKQLLSLPEEKALRGIVSDPIFNTVHSSEGVGMGRIWKALRNVTGSSDEDIEERAKESIADMQRRLCHHLESAKRHTSKYLNYLDNLLAGRASPLLDRRVTRNNITFWSNESQKWVGQEDLIVVVNRLRKFMTLPETFHKDMEKIIAVQQLIDLERDIKVKQLPFKKFQEMKDAEELAGIFNRCKGTTSDVIYGALQLIAQRLGNGASAAKLGSQLIEAGCSRLGEEVTKEQERWHKELSQRATSREPIRVGDKQYLLTTFSKNWNGRQGFVCCDLEGELNKVLISGPNRARIDLEQMALQKWTSREVRPIACDYIDSGGRFAIYEKVTPIRAKGSFRDLITFLLKKKKMPEDLNLLPFGCDHQGNLVLTRPMKMVPLDIEIVEEKLVNLECPQERADLMRDSGLEDYCQARFLQFAMRHAMGFKEPGYSERLAEQLHPSPESYLESMAQNKFHLYNPQSILGQASKLRSEVCRGRDLCVEEVTRVMSPLLENPFREGEIKAIIERQISDYLSDYSIVSSLPRTFTQDIQKRVIERGSWILKKEEVERLLTKHQEWAELGAAQFFQTYHVHNERQRRDIRKGF